MATVDGDDSSLSRLALPVWRSSMADMWFIQWTGCIGVNFYKAARLEPPTFQTPRLSVFWHWPPIFVRRGRKRRGGDGRRRKGRWEEEGEGRGKGHGGQYLEEVYAYDRMNSCNDFRVMAQTSSLTLQWILLFLISSTTASAPNSWLWRHGKRQDNYRGAPAAL